MTTDDDKRSEPREPVTPVETPVDAEPVSLVSDQAIKRKFDPEFSRIVAALAAKANAVAVTAMHGEEGSEDRQSHDDARRASRLAVLRGIIDDELEAVNIPPISRGADVVIVTHGKRQLVSYLSVNGYQLHGARVVWIRDKF